MDTYFVISEADWLNRANGTLRIQANPPVLSQVDASLSAGYRSGREQKPFLVVQAVPISRHIASISIQVEPITDPNDLIPKPVRP
jgi:hypothetical protein